MCWKGHSINSMKLLKSQFQLILDLYEALLLHYRVSQDSYFVSQSRLDFATIAARSTSMEGIQFLTKTLPKLGKALQQGLLKNKFYCPREFGRKPNLSGENKSIPEFLHAYFNLVFDEDGVLRDDAQVWAIRHIQQVCFFVYKLKLPYSEAEQKRVIAKFIQNEQDLSLLTLPDSILLDRVQQITYDVFKDFDPLDIIPRHGPGAVASGEEGEDKWQFTTIYDQLHQKYPSYTYFMIGGAHELIDRLGWYRGLRRTLSGTAKVSLVPKDSRGPRLISSEPLEFMWIQQGLGRSISSWLEDQTSITSGQINFRNQKVNRNLALLGSMTIPPTGGVTSSRLCETTRENCSNSLPRIQSSLYPSLEGPVKKFTAPESTGYVRAWLREQLSFRRIPITLQSRYGIITSRAERDPLISHRFRYATLDLKDASDRVSLDLVRRTFSKVPQLLQHLEACRTTATTLPNGSVLTQLKYAPMGSALCFPIEAYVFWIWIVAAISLRREVRLSEVRQLVYVYGDDIIVPDIYAKLAMQALESVGLIVNRDKSCIEGDFRESCGVEAFRGNEIQPVRLRNLFNFDKSDGENLLSVVATANLLCRAGYGRAAECIFKVVEKKYGKLPYGTFRAPYVCREVQDVREAEYLNRTQLRSRWNSQYQCLEFRLLRVMPVKVDSKLDGWTRLLRNLTQGVGDEPSKVVVPDATNLQRVWTSTL